jgi:hypothetical protein
MTNAVWGKSIKLVREKEEKFERNGKKKGYIKMKVR